MEPARRTPAPAFTLVELLVVVAIIAILAAVAIPNLLEALTRSNVARAKADMRALATALEAYRVDQKGYPPSATFLASEDLFRLTTPIAYMGTVAIEDPFSRGFATLPGGAAQNPERGYAYVTYDGESPFLQIYPPT